MVLGPTLMFFGQQRNGITNNLYGSWLVISSKSKPMVKMLKLQVKVS
jgi:hypothetical protein